MSDPDNTYAVRYDVGPAPAQARDARMRAQLDAIPPGEPLNFVLCAHCGGNLADRQGHSCPGRVAAAQSEMSRMFDSLKWPDARHESDALPPAGPQTTVGGPQTLADAQVALTDLRAENVRLWRCVDRVEALAAKFEQWPSGPSYAVTARAIRKALAQP